MLKASSSRIYLYLFLVCVKIILSTQNIGSINITFEVISHEFYTYPNNCVLQKHANSELQKPTNICIFLLLSVTITATVDRLAKYRNEQSGFIFANRKHSSITF